MRTIAFGNVSLMTEINFECKLRGVSQEDVSLGSGGEIVEEVLVEDTVFRTVGAVDEFLVDFPADRTHVPVLADGLFHVDAVAVELFHFAGYRSTEIVS